MPVGAHAEYDDLLARAVSVHQLPFTESNSESHMAASKLMLDDADDLYPVWDGKPARGYGEIAKQAAHGDREVTTLPAGFIPDRLA